jgi:hypothetical protein
LLCRLLLLVAKFLRLGQVDELPYECLRHVIGLKKIILLATMLIISDFTFLINCFLNILGNEIKYVSTCPYKLLIKVRDDFRRPLILKHGVIDLARAREIVSYSRCIEADCINIHIINFCMSKIVQVN